MKITKEGEVISCCEWVREIGRSDSLKIDPFDSQGDVTVPWLRIRQIGKYLKLEIGSEYTHHKE